MTNSTYELDPKYKLLASLQEECFKGNVTKTHSRIFIYGSQNVDVWCPRIFDGFLCWDETPASSTAAQSCPEYVIGFDPLRTVYKLCTSDGTWQNGETGRPWTDYRSCVDTDDLCWGAVGRTLAPIYIPPDCPKVNEWFRMVINYIYVVGYIISVISLIGAMIIFIYFRNLRCARIQIHMHLFTSFIISNILWIVWYLLIVNDVEVIQENPVWCRVFHLVSFYFTIANYAWMFVECQFLHISLVVVFINNPRTVRRFVAFAWGGPAIVVVVYAVVRQTFTDDTDKCWIDFSSSIWCVIAPVGMCLFISSMILLNVIRDLYTKSSKFPQARSSIAAKKAARAAIILIPLFGTHFILIPLRISPDTPGEKVYQLACALLTSPQGLWLAILFCFTNQDVTNAINRFLSRNRQRNEIESPRNAIPLDMITPPRLNIEIIHTHGAA